MAHQVLGDDLFHKEAEVVVVDDDDDRGLLCPVYGVVPIEECIGRPFREDVNSHVLLCCCPVMIRPFVL